MYFGPYLIEEGDKISWDLSAEGKGILITSFTKEKDNTVSYWTQTGAGNENKIKKSWIPSEHQFGYIFEQGFYYLLVGNVGNEPLKNISGNVTVTNTSDSIN